MYWRIWTKSTLRTWRTVVFCSRRGKVHCFWGDTSGRSPPPRGCPLPGRSCTVPVLYCTVLYCTVLNCTVLYWTILYCTVLYQHCTSCTCRRRRSMWAPALCPTCGSSSWTRPAGIITIMCRETRVLSLCRSLGIYLYTFSLLAWWKYDVWDIIGSTGGMYNHSITLPIYWVPSTMQGSINIKNKS